jgi:hypothetical protein
MRMVAVAGVTVMLTSAAPVTVNPVVPTMVPRVAVTVTVPGLSAVASPWEPAALLKVATAPVVGAQVTNVVRSWVELSVYVPVAVNG